MSSTRLPGALGLCCSLLAGGVGAQDVVSEPVEFAGEAPGSGDSGTIAWGEHLAASSPAADIIADSTWEELAGDRAYERVDPEEPAPPNEGFKWVSGLLNGLSVLAWVIIAGLILAVVAFLFYYNRRDTKVAERRPGGLTDELLGASRADIDEGLARDLADGDYRSAIRYRFGQLLQDLRAARYLRWVPGKTNEEYAAELPGALRGSFGRLSESFAYAFYSGRPIDEGYYLGFSAEADALAALLTPSSATQIPGR